MTDQTTDVMRLIEEAKVLAGPPCTCGRVGWGEVSRCLSWGCAGRRLAKIMLEPAHAR